jgi:hypothetical protein
MWSEAGELISGPEEDLRMHRTYSVKSAVALDYRGEK